MDFIYVYFFCWNFFHRYPQFSELSSFSTYRRFTITTTLLLFLRHSSSSSSSSPNSPERAANNKTHSAQNRDINGR